MHAFIQGLHDDRAGGFHGFGSAIRRLHCARRGNVSMLFVFIGLALFCAASMVWNTGETVAARVELQTAADASAYSSSMWNTRTVNNITGTNMLILRNASAFAVSIDSVLTTVLIIVNWTSWAHDIAKGCGPYYGACFAAAWAYILATEGPAFFEFTTSALPEAIEGFGEFPDRLDELFKYEKSWVEAAPKLIESQREKLEEYYDCSIHVTRPGLEGRVEPPLRRGNFGTILLPLIFRFYLVDNGWPEDSDFRDIEIGKSVQSWNIGGILSVLIAAAIVNDDHYVLPTMRAGFLEKGPQTLEEWKAFTVVAVARREHTSRGKFVAPGVFNDPPIPGDLMTAYAQAETYNGIDGRLTKFSFAGVEAIVQSYPFRVWTTWGWQWQSRLALADQLRAAIESDPVLEEWFNDLDISAGTTNGWEALQDVGLH